MYYQVQVYVPDTCEAKVKLGVWSRERLIAGPGKDRWLRPQNTASSAFGKEFLKSQVMEEFTGYVISSCTSF